MHVIGWTVSTLTSPLGMPSPLSTSPIPISVEGNGILATQVSNQDTAVLLHYP
jgi:hypothetical protein